LAPLKSGFPSLGLLSVAARRSLVSIQTELFTRNRQARAPNVWLSKVELYLEAL